MRKTRSIDTLHLIVTPTVGLKVCPECKKKFEWFGEQWVYRNIRHGEKRYYCSYKCWRAEDHRKEAKGQSLFMGLCSPRPMRGMVSSRKNYKKR